MIIGSYTTRFVAAITIDGFRPRERKTSAGTCAGMPRYYFDIQNDGTAADDTGVELPDIDAARSEAAKALLEYSREPSLREFPWTIGVDVSDEKHKLLFQVTLTLALAKKKAKATVQPD